VAQALDIDLVLVTGAGASSAFGVDGNRLPLMGGWSDHLVGRLREGPMGYLAATGLGPGMAGEEFELRLGQFLRSVEAFKGVGQLLGPLTSIEPNRRPQANEGEWHAWHEALSFQLDQIVKVIHESLYEMFGAPVFDPGLAELAYAALLAAVGITDSSRWVYATTNYDTIGETALARNRWLPDGGELQTDSGVSERPIHVEGLLGGIPRYVPVLHLHGRVGWFRRADVGLRSIPVSRYDSNIGTPVVMLPDLEKSYDGDPTIEALWRELHAALTRAKRVFVLGHSLHDRALLAAMRDAVQEPRRIAVSVYDAPEPGDAGEVRVRVERELPGASVIPFRFEAHRELRSEMLQAWIAETAG
jgi:hypothetical protein